MEDYEVYAERRSIYKDIEEINKAIIMLEQYCTAEEAEKILAEDEYNEEKLILKNKRGFYAKRRNYDENDIRLLAECIYSSKFIAEGQAKRLVDVFEINEINTNSEFYSNIMNERLSVA